MSSDKTHAGSQKSKKARRRPGRDPVEDQVADVKPEKVIDASLAPDITPESEAVSRPETTHRESFEQEPQRKKVKLEFYGSEILKQKAPAAFDLAENVAEEWVNDGRFEDLPVDHPLAKAVAAYGLRKAKKIEKKLEEKGVIAIVKMGIGYAQSKIRR